MRDEHEYPTSPGAGAATAARSFRQPAPLHGRESHIRIFEDGDSGEEREVYGATQVSADGSLPQEEHGPSAVLKALDPFWTRGIIPDRQDTEAGTD